MPLKLANAFINGEIDVSNISGNLTTCSVLTELCSTDQASLTSSPSFIESIIKFLSAGGSQSPDDIFKSIGIDTTKPEFFLEGLKEIEAEIVRLEGAARKLGMI